MTKTEQVNNVLKDKYVYLNSKDSTLDFFPSKSFLFKGSKHRTSKKVFESTDSKDSY